MFRLAALAFLLSWLPILSYAGIIKGKVSGANKEGLAFANVAVRGAATSTGANEQGEFHCGCRPGNTSWCFSTWATGRRFSRCAY
ncbi:hypothetical protein ACFQT0_03120 [Hymenobacter humi]|uniref:Carboxypeptidase regulatory-like domain-containing protein n=1 Tax=Hymenobacter humi TaxID=1411620 RepID=A0ABW2U135_9BACT